MGKSRVQVKCPQCEHVFLPSLEETQSRAGASSRRKGHAFERKVAKLLQDWWNSVKSSEQKCEMRRTPQSGGSALKIGWDLAGDISSTANDFRFHIEAKNAPGSFGGWHQLFTSKKFIIWDWLEQANEDCQENRIPILIVNRFDQPTYCVAGPHKRLCACFIERLSKSNIDYLVYHNKNRMLVIWGLNALLNSYPYDWLFKFKCCSGCDRVLPASRAFFTKQAAGKFGLTSECKDCASVYRTENRAALQERQREWRHQNPDKMKAQRAGRSDHIHNYNINYLIRERRKEQDKIRNADPSIRRIINERNRNKYNNNIKYRLRMVLSSRINAAVRGICASASTLELLGCSLSEYVQYLEAKFKPGMTWGNYGIEWHIDHIIPCSAFDLIMIDEQKKCFHYTNTQPLFAIDNLRKGDSIAEEEK